MIRWREGWGGGFFFVADMEHNLLDAQTQRKLLSWYDIVTKQNHFIHKNDIIIQNDGLGMGAPSSGIITEIFLQYIVNSHLAHLAEKRRIINYFRYVDDILLIFDSEHTNTQATVNYFKLHSRNRIKQDYKLFRHIHPQDTH